MNPSQRISHSARQSVHPDYSYEENHHAPPPRFGGQASQNGLHDITPPEPAFAQSSAASRPSSWVQPPSIHSNNRHADDSASDEDAEDDDDEDFYTNPETASNLQRPSHAYNPKAHPQQLYTPAPAASQHLNQQQQPSNPPSPPPLLDHSHLRPGQQASLLSYERTLALYRENAKKTNIPEVQYEFAVFMIDAAKNMPMPQIADAGRATLELEKVQQKREDLVREATVLLKKLADRGHPDSQYFLADCYANGIGTPRGRQDFDRAYPLFVLAAKHGHADAAYRSGTCCENGWGCRRESSKAVQFYRKAAAALHPGAMYRLGLAELNGELGLTKSPKEGVKWLKRSAEHATDEFPHGLHELALLHERGIDNVLFVDYEYSAELLAQASELGYAPSAYRLGECYEYGKMGCPQDPALSIHYYNIAAQQNHRDACFALTAWYLVGSPGVLPQSDTEAYLWARKAAEQGLAKAQYAVGYFSEVGIGIPQSLPAAIQWYKQAAAAGDKRALQRLKGPAGPLPGKPLASRNNSDPQTDMDGAESKSSGKTKDKEKDCIIM